MATVVCAVNDSPVKPNDIAMEPDEDAHWESCGTKNKDGVGKTTDEVDGDVSSREVVITSEMIDEENNLEEEGEKEEEKLRKEHDKTWQDLAAEDREQRYKRLQFLLSKSNLYTQYLLSRMEKQRAEQSKKADRTKKKQEKEKKKQDEASSKSSNTDETPLSPVVTASDSDGAASPGTRRSTRGSKPSTPSNSQESKRGRKRKATSAISPETKKQKKDESGEDEPHNDKENCPGKEQTENEGTAHDNDKEDSAAKQQTDEGKTASDDNEPKDSLDEATGKPPKLFTGGSLRDYQLEGYNWLKVLYENGVNGILADEMGLGKTVQCIAMMAHLVNMGVPGPFLVVVPLSTLPNWQSEFERFAPKVPVVVYHGLNTLRPAIRRKIFKKYPIRPGVEVRPVVITSYEMCIIDRAALQNFEWKYLIVDEGHRIKNTNCRLIRELRLYKNTHRLLLTGTPLQNNLSELWSLLNFLLPEIFDDLGSFEAWFDVERISEADADKKIVQEEQQKNILSMLHQILTPFMLRRLKQDVDLAIPPKKEVLVYAPMSKIQTEFYEGTVNRTIFKMIEEKNAPPPPELDANGRPIRNATKKKVNYDLMIATEKELDDESPKRKKTQKRIEKDEEELEKWVQAMVQNQESMSSSKEEKTKTAQVTIRLQNVMMQLRKCCNHPYLLEYPLTEDQEYRIDEELISSCGKMVLLDKMLDELKKNGHKVLIFSQMTKMLDILTDYCYLRKINYCRLDGSYSLQDRKEQMDSFNKDPEMFLFLVSTRAGGLGINLTAADTVILYDSDWNPQCDLQAQDRCHRIGQTKPVVVYRFVTANTIDQRIVERAAAKRKLEKMVIHKGKFKTGMKDYKADFKPLTPQELQELLLTKDHQMVVKGEDENSCLGEKELKILMDRSDLVEKWAAITGNKKGTKKGSKKKATKATKSSKKVQGLFRVIDNDDDDASEATEEDIQELSELAGLS